MPREDDDYDAPAPKPAEGGSGTAGFVLSIIGITLGVLALALSLVECLGVFAFWPGVFAVILSVLGLVLSKGNKALPIIAVVVSVLATGIAYWQGTRIEARLKRAAEEGQKVGNQIIDNINKMQPKGPPGGNP
jgi:membrane protein DedA with SNARE-associated domain